MTSPTPQPGLPVKCRQLDSAHSPPRAERGARQRPEGGGDAVFAVVGQPQQDVAEDVVDEEVFFADDGHVPFADGRFEVEGNGKEEEFKGQRSSCC